MTFYLLDAPRTAAASRRAAVLALALGAFAIGTSEFMISGLLGEVASDLDVSIPSAGLLITGYAGGVAIGGPLLTIATGGLDPRRQIMLLLAIFILGNVLCALSPSYESLLAGRIAGAFCHGAFYGVASVASGFLVPANHRARAVALISAGVMIANIVGVPLGTVLGQIAGWRTAFWAVSALGAVAALGLAIMLPANIGAARAGLVAEISALLRPQVLTGLVLGLCFTIGLFTCFTYLTPLLTMVSGAAPGQVPLLLMVFGVGATAGVLGGGRLSDRGLRSAVAIGFAAQIAVYGLMIALSDSLDAMWIVLFLLGLSSMSVVAPIRMIVLNGAADAPGLAATVTSSAFNSGVAIGAALGAGLLGGGAPYNALPLVGIVLAAIGLVIAIVRHTLQSPVV
jgi:MFS transporter, DHA1 family, inner membrane transport protein